MSEKFAQRQKILSSYDHCFHFTVVLRKKPGHFNLRGNHFFKVYSDMFIFLQHRTFYDLLYIFSTMLEGE